MIGDLNIHVVCAIKSSEDQGITLLLWQAQIKNVAMTATRKL